MPKTTIITEEGLKLMAIATKNYLVFSGGFLCPATKLLLLQTPCVTDASPKINSKTPTQSQLATTTRTLSTQIIRSQDDAGGKDNP